MAVEYLHDAQQLLGPSILISPGGADVHSQAASAPTGAQCAVAPPPPTRGRVGPSPPHRTQRLLGPSITLSPQATIQSIKLPVFVPLQAASASLQTQQSVAAPPTSGSPVGPSPRAANPLGLSAAAGHPPLAAYHPPSIADSPQELASKMPPKYPPFARPLAEPPSTVF